MPMEYYPSWRKPKKKRGKRPVNEDFGTLRGTSPSHAPAGLSPRLAASIKYAAYSVKRPQDHSRTSVSGNHEENLLLNRAFFASLNPGSRVLEAGSWSGRLANHIISKSNIPPGNYVMLDLKYKGALPFLRKKIYLLHKNKQIHMAEGNIFEEKLPENSYDHILLPQSFFPKELDNNLYMQLIQKNQAELRKLLSTASEVKVVSQVNAANTMLQLLVGKLAPAVKVNGSIRISSQIYGDAFPEAGLGRLFPNFSVVYTPQGVILTRLK